MKLYEREEARRLRREEGLSVKEICQRLGVAKSSVSLWVRNVELTEEQKAGLKHRHPMYHGQHKGSQTNADKARKLRQHYQDEGRAKAKERDALHIAGCMLYWAEGAKDRCSLKFVNSDADMLKFYVEFLRESLKVENDKIHIHINCYLDNGLTLQDIEDYWLQLLALPRSSWKASRVNMKPVSSQQRGRKLLYGMCEVNVHTTKLVQQVYGAIQEYAGIDKPEWLM